MSEELWKKVDKYFADKLVEQDPALDQAIRSITDAGLPPISVSPGQGKFLHLLARMQGAENILEIGTLGGYSTIWLGRALPPSGHLITLEMDPRHAEVARANIDRAGLSNVVELRLGKALDTLPKLAAEGQGPFDLFFIDADKSNIPHYVEWALRLSHKGSVIVIDNVVRHGKVVHESRTDENVIGVRKMFEMLSTDRRLSAAAIQTVGSKGYDGFAIALVIENAANRKPKRRRKRKN
jgi:predicted O-methyltransferase YrrM